VFATTETNPNRWNLAIPLSVLAVTAHPLHKSHRYERKADYAWLESLSNGGSPNPQLPAAKYLYPQVKTAKQKVAENITTEEAKKKYNNDFSAEWESINALRKSSFEFRQYAYQHAVESLRFILQGNNQELATAMGVSKENCNSLAAALCRVESGEGYLPGPGLSVVNESKYVGWGQFGASGLTPPLIDENRHWAGHEVEGKPINNWSDFLASPAAQRLAIDGLILDSYVSLKDKIDAGYNPFGVIAAAHISGAPNTKEVLERFSPEQMNDPATRNAEGLPLDANKTTPVDYYQMFSGYYPSQQQQRPR
jgi:hypothetical protein